MPSKTEAEKVMDKGFAVVDGRVVKKGPAAIFIEAADIKRWEDAENERKRANNRLERVPALFWTGTVGIALVILAEMLLVYNFGFSVWKMPGLNLLVMADPHEPIRALATAFGVFWIVYLVFFYFYIYPKRQRANKVLEEKRQTLLAHYGNYKLDEVTTFDNWRYGWREAKYVLLAKES